MKRVAGGDNVIRRVWRDQPRALGVPPTWHLAQILRRLNELPERGWPQDNDAWQELIAAAVPAEGCELCWTDGACQPAVRGGIGAEVGIEQLAVEKDAGFAGVRRLRRRSCGRLPRGHRNARVRERAQRGQILDLQPRRGNRGARRLRHPWTVRHLSLIPI